jgi:hypothetical protein
MSRSRLGLIGGAAAIAGAVFILLGLFVYADRSGPGSGPMTELTGP